MFLGVGLVGVMLSGCLLCLGTASGVCVPGICVLLLEYFVLRFGLLLGFYVILFAWFLFVLFARVVGVAGGCVCFCVGVLMLYLLCF